MKYLSHVIIGIVILSLILFCCHLYFDRSLMHHSRVIIRPVQTLETFGMDQGTYCYDHGRFGTIEEISMEIDVDYSILFTDYTMIDLIKPTSEYFAVMLSPKSFGGSRDRHFVLSSSSLSIRYTTVKEHGFQNMPSTKASIDKINLLPVCRP